MHRSGGSAIRSQEIDGIEVLVRTPPFFPRVDVLCVTGTSNKSDNRSTSSRVNLELDSRTHGNCSQPCQDTDEALYRAFQGQIRCWGFILGRGRT